MLVLKSNKTLRRYLLYAKDITIFAGEWDYLLGSILSDMIFSNLNFNLKIFYKSTLQLLFLKNTDGAIYNNEYLWIGDNILLLIDNRILILGIKISQQQLGLETDTFKYVVFEDNVSLVTTFLAHIDNLSHILKQDKTTQAIKRLFSMLGTIEQAISRYDCALLPGFKPKLKDLAYQSKSIAHLVDSLLYHWEMRKFDEALHIIRSVYANLFLPVGPLDLKHLDFNYIRQKRQFISDFYHLLQNIDNELQNRLFYFTAKTKDELTPLLRTLINEKLSIIDLQLKFIDDPKLAKKLEKIRQDYEIQLKLLNNEPAEFYKIPERYANLRLLSQNEQKRLQQIYHETIKIIHPDRLIGQEQAHAQNFVKILNEAYKHDDLKTIEALHKIAKDIRAFTDTSGLNRQKIELASLSAAVLYYKNHIAYDIMSPMATASNIKEALEATVQSIKQEITNTQLQKFIIEISYNMAANDEQETDGTDGD